MWCEQLAELHKPIKRHFPKRRVYVTGANKIWAADLKDIKHFSKSNDGMKYLLAVIDIFSKYGWLVPLKDKSGISVSKAFETIIEQKTKPERFGLIKEKNSTIRTLRN